jgi:hypothetical protein
VIVVSVELCGFMSHARASPRGQREPSRVGFGIARALEGQTLHGAGLCKEFCLPLGLSDEGRAAIMFCETAPRPGNSQTVTSSAHVHALQLEICSKRVIAKKLMLIQHEASSFWCQLASRSGNRMCNAPHLFGNFALQCARSLRKLEPGMNIAERKHQ